MTDNKPQTSPSGRPINPLADLPPALRTLAEQATRVLQSGQPELARRAFEQVLADAPDHATVLRLTGMAQRMSGHHAEAVTTLRRARQAAPDDALTASSLGAALMTAGHEEEGLAELQRACELAPQSAALWNNLGKALLDRERAAQAVPALQKAVALQPGLDPARLSLAHALTYVGDAEGAASQFRALLQKHPGDGSLWNGLAALKSGQLDAEDIASMRRLLARPDLPSGNRSQTLYALGAALHEQHDYAGAWDAWQKANALVRRHISWDRAAFSARVDAFLAADWPVAPTPPTAPPVLFLVGTPRSGSSLLEQVLAMHSRVGSGGEMAFVDELFQDIDQRQRGNLLAGLQAQTAEQWQALGERYLQRARGKVGDLPVLTDKRLGHWMFIGPLLAMLPSARVIVCRRDPLESTFSCWRHAFGAGAQLFSYDLDSLAAHWHDMDRATRQWQARYPQRVMSLQHEALLADPEPCIRDLLDFCGLPFEADCLHPESSQASVGTLSALQVRQPIRPVPRASERYGPLLDPLREALRRAGVAV